MKNLKIGTRLALAFALLLSLSVVLAGVGWRRLADLSDRLNTLANVDNRMVDDLSEVARGVNMRAIAARNLVFVSDPQARGAELQRISDGQKDIDHGFQALSELLAKDGTDDERSKLEDLKALEAQYLPIATRIVQLATSNDLAGATQDLTSKCMPLLAKVTAHLQAFQDRLHQTTRDVAQKAQQDYRNAVALLLSVTLAVLGAGTALAWWLTRSITAPIRQAVALTETVARGDLRSRIEVTSRDETGQLLGALQRMNGELLRIVGSVRGNADSVATASSQIAQGNADLSQRTEEQASNLQQTAASMEQLTATVKQNAETARQAVQLATTASGVAGQGGEVVGRVVATMEDISASSKKIADIIGVIDGIAFQTNILALNAAVEAARAGEQGRGFAVVAGEVRSLAQRSAEAAKEIKNLIGASVEKVATGSSLVGDAGRTMGEIVSQVKRVTDLINEISAASVEQTTGIGQIGDAVTQLDQVTQQNAALVEESAAAADSLQQQASQLAQAISFFTLDDPQSSGSRAT
jgi:methyl-accepting chemotaxis protein